MRRLGGPRFEVFSAGSFPTGKVNPLAVQVLHDVYNIDASEACSKSWEEFKDVEFDFVVTVCDNARETCPIWPGQPMSAHWGVPDPALAEGTEAEKELAFADAYRMLFNRISIFANLPIAGLDRMKLQKHLDEIGRHKG